jgi:hypothetical protein
MGIWGMRDRPYEGWGMDDGNGTCGTWNLRDAAWGIWRMGDDGTWGIQSLHRKLPYFFRKVCFKSNSLLSPTRTMTECGVKNGLGNSKKPSTCFND